MSDNEPNNDDLQDARKQRVAVWLSVGLIVFGGLVALGIRWIKTAPPEAIADTPIETPVAKIRKVMKRKITPPVAAFKDVAAEAGVNWTQVNGANGNMYFPESMGTGVAWVDWDNDLDPDLLFVNHTHWPEDEGQVPPGFLAAYENDGKGNFKDVTEALGLKLSLYGTGIATGDYDGDGFTDLYITALGHNRLFRNLGGKRFEDVTVAMKVAGDAGDYSTCAGFFDADGDGDLDLIVGGYALWNKEVHTGVSQVIPGIGRVYNDPDELEGQFGRIFRNDGATGFTEQTDAWGFKVVDDTTQKPIGKNLGFGFGYFNEDRILDVVVANDQVRNLFLLSEDATFIDRALERGFAYDRRGKPSAAMGIDVDLDLATQEHRVVMGNFYEEMTSLYVNAEGATSFIDESVAEGIGPRTNARTTFGALFVDYDNDGYRDIFEVNGAIQEITPKLFKGEVGVPYRQPGDIFWHCGGRCRTTYLYLGGLSGDFAKRIVGRGLAAADMDGDGDLDLVATGIQGPAYLYRNDTETSHHWLRVKLKGNAPNTDAIGAELILTAGEHQQYRLVQPSRSYLSANELVQTFGLGQWDDEVTLKVVWPNGQSQTHTVDDVDQLVVFEEP